MSATPTFDELKQWISAIEKEVLNNLVPFWDKIAQPLVAEEIARVFVTQGYGTWAPLSERYALYKSRVYPGRTILRRKDTYFRASTRKGPGNTYERDKDKMEWGVDLSWFANAYGFPYPIVHETGGSKMPPRPVYQLAAESRALENHLVIGLRSWLQKSIERESRKYF